MRSRWSLIKLELLTQLFSRREKLSSLLALFECWFSSSLVETLSQVYLSLAHGVKAARGCCKTTERCSYMHEATARAHTLMSLGDQVENKLSKAHEMNPRKAVDAGWVPLWLSATGFNHGKAVSLSAEASVSFRRCLGAVLLLQKGAEEPI